MTVIQRLRGASEGRSGALVRVVAVGDATAAAEEEEDEEDNEDQEGDSILGLGGLQVCRPTV